MAKALKEMHQRIRETDLVIETRDARLPLSSINPAFEDMLQAASVNDSQSARPTPHRLIVYNKKDLADPRLERVCLFQDWTCLMLSLLTQLTTYSAWCTL